MMSLISVLNAGAAFLAQATPHPLYTNPGFGYGIIGVGIGVGMASLGAGLGISRLAASSVESMARQPEASGDIRGAMILTAAFIEGVCLFAVVTSLLAVLVNLNK
jgi:F-type H+-transporting ATPase subunit c